ncbi:hypothetical protein AALP_AAs41155U000100, partial [Arabis alpina]
MTTETVVEGQDGDGDNDCKQTAMDYIVEDKIATKTSSLIVKSISTWSKIRTVDSPANSLTLYLSKPGHSISLQSIPVLANNHLIYAGSVFDRIQSPYLPLWNMMIKCYVANRRSHDAIVRQYYTKGDNTRENLADLLGQRKLAIFERNASKLIGLVTEFRLSGKAFEAQDMLMRFTLDSIFKVGFGVKLRCLDGFSKKGEEFVEAFDE